MIAKMKAVYQELDYFAEKLASKYNKGDLITDEILNLIIYLYQAAKAGWIQPVFSEDRFNSDLTRYKIGKSKTHPEEIISKFNNQVNKYLNVFKIKKTQFFLLLPTLTHVHRKKYKADINNYYNYFSKVSGLSNDNFVLLSNNKLLDLSNPQNIEHEPTQNFENMLGRILLYGKK